MQYTVAVRGSEQQVDVIELAADSLEINAEARCLVVVAARQPAMVVPMESLVYAATHGIEESLRHTLSRFIEAGMAKDKIQVTLDKLMEACD